MADFYECWNGFLNLLGVGDTRPRYVNWFDGVRPRSADFDRFKSIVTHAPPAGSDERTWRHAATALGPEMAAVISVLDRYQAPGEDVRLHQLADPAVRAHLSEIYGSFVSAMGPGGDRRFDAIL